jgi:hypothetical protein
VNAVRCILTTITATDHMQIPKEASTRVVLIGLWCVGYHVKTELPGSTCWRPESMCCVARRPYTPLSALSKTSVLKGPEVL